jgi:alpha-tubulin suppressor-like RCC1 family protein
MLLGGFTHTEIAQSSQLVTSSPVFTEISSGSNHVCAITDQKQIYCWGQNVWSQLGTSEYLDNLVPRLVYQISDATSIASGEMHTCAIVFAGQVKCWGNNSKGQIGDGIRKFSLRELPVFVHAVSGAKKVALGSEHTCALIQDGSVKCWGSNVSGQLGDGTKSDSILPIDVKSQFKFVDLAAGSNHTCAIDELGDVYCWGENSNGQLGNGSKIAKSLPSLTLGISKASNLTARFNSTCATDSNSQGNCWGEGTNGQLGNQDVVDKSIPTKVVDLYLGSTTNSNYYPANSVKEVQAGISTSCVLSKLSTLHCWGSQSGSKIAGSPYYVGVIESSGNAWSVEKFSVGESFYCFIRKGGFIYCSGLNSDGQFGIGSKQNTSTTGLVPLNYWPSAPHKFVIEPLGNTLKFSWTRDITDYDPLPTAKNLPTTFTIKIDGSDLSCEATSAFTCTIGPIKSNTTYRIKITTDNTKKVTESFEEYTTKEILSEQELREKNAKEEAEARLKREAETAAKQREEEETKRKEAEKLAATQAADAEKQREIEKQIAAQKLQDELIANNRATCFAFAQKIEDLRFALLDSKVKFALTSFEKAYNNLIASLPVARNCLKNDYSASDFDNPAKSLEIVSLAKIQLDLEANKLVRQGKLIYNFTCTKGSSVKRFTKTKVACPAGYKLKN